MSDIIDGWENKEEKKDKSNNGSFVFPNSDISVLKTDRVGFCCQLTKEIYDMRKAGVDIETCLDCAYKWTGEWGGFKYQIVLAHSIINDIIAFFPESTEGMSAPARAVYAYWLRYNEYKWGKKKEIIEAWCNHTLEFPDLKEFIDRMEGVNE